MADRQPLHVAGLGDGDDHLLLGDEVLDVEVALVGHDLGAAVVVVVALDLEQLALDDRVDGVLVAEQLAQLLDARQQLLVLLLDLVALEAGEALEPQVEDGLRLRPRELEGVHERRRAPRRTSGALRMMLMTWSRLSSATSRPSRMCARVSALSSSNLVRRMTISFWKAM